MFNLTQIKLYFPLFIIISFLFPSTSISSSSELNQQNNSVSISGVNSQLSFNFPEPNIYTLQEELNLWSTYYYIHEATTIEGEETFPLLDYNYQPLGIELSHKDWCYSALQGTVRIFDENNNYHTYNYHERGELQQADCSEFFSSLSEETLERMSRNLFRPVDSPYGDGTDGFILLPYRSIAVDTNLMPLGTVIYIPSARGVEITLPSGQSVTHDGYFFAADIGSAIQGNKIDTFLGIDKRNPFSHVLSRQTGTFQAFIVNDPNIKATLTNAHLPF